MSLLIQRIDAWSWRLIFVGLALAGLGLAVRRSDAELGGWIVVVGVVAMGVGAGLIWWRSRLDDAGRRSLP